MDTESCFIDRRSTSIYVSTHDLLSHAEKQHGMAQFVWDCLKGPILTEKGDLTRYPQSRARVGHHPGMTASLGCHGWHPKGWGNMEPRCRDAGSNIWMSPMQALPLGLCTDVIRKIVGPFPVVTKSIAIDLPFKSLYLLRGSGLSNTRHTV